MQAIKNKLHLNKNNANNTTTNTSGEKKHSLFGGHHNTSSGLGKNNTTTTTTTAAPASAIKATEAIAATLPHGSTVERTETTRTTTVDDHVHAPLTTESSTDVKINYDIPTAPVAPAVWAPENHERWSNLDNLHWTRGTGFGEWNSSSSSSFNSSSSNSYGYGSESFAAKSDVIVRESLPVQVIEKPIVVHEEIRQEHIEEIQPVINIEKLHTEVHQVTQPLFDKEIKPVIIQERLLAQEILPEVLLPGRGLHANAEVSSLRVQDTAAVVIEKPAIYTEIDRLQIIEEIQPVLYKETVVPTVIQETKPIYQKIIEGPVYVHETRAPRDISGTEFSHLHTSTYDHSRSVGLSTAAVPVVMAAPVVMMQEKTIAQPGKLVETNQTTTTTTVTNQANLPTYAL